MEKDNKTILVFAPHPDDEIIGCGGFILNRIEKYHIKIAYITNGSYHKLKHAPQIKKMRIKETKKVCSILNAEPFYLNQKDRFISKTELLIQKIVNLIHECKPKIILLPHSEDEDNDHKEVFKIINEAILIASKIFTNNCWKPELVLGYEVWTPLSKYNYVEDISEVINKKLKILKLYNSQISQIRFDLAVKGLNRRHGIITCKGKYCEVYKIYHSEGV